MSSHRGARSPRRALPGSDDRRTRPSRHRSSISRAPTPRNAITGLPAAIASTGAMPKSSTPGTTYAWQRANRSRRSARRPDQGSVRRGPARPGEPSPFGSIADGPTSSPVQLVGSHGAGSSVDRGSISGGDREEKAVVAPGHVDLINVDGRSNYFRISSQELDPLPSRTAAEFAMSRSGRLPAVRVPRRQKPASSDRAPSRAGSTVGPSEVLSRSQHSASARRRTRGARVEYGCAPISRRPASCFRTKSYARRSTAEPHGIQREASSIVPGSALQSLETATYGFDPPSKAPAQYGGRGSSYRCRRLGKEPAEARSRPRSLRGENQFWTSALRPSADAIVRLLRGPTRVLSPAAQ